MKLNAKNYEWILFDLLEGNLSHHDELLVMEQIEESEFLFKEWKLLKQTKISADDEVVYSHTSDLLKPLSKKRYFMDYGQSIAASILFILLITLMGPVKLGNNSFLLNSSIPNYSPKSTTEEASIPLKKYQQHHGSSTVNISGSSFKKTLGKPILTEKRSSEIDVWSQELELPVSLFPKDVSGFLDNKRTLFFQPESLKEIAYIDNYKSSKQEINQKLIYPVVTFKSYGRIIRKAMAFRSNIENPTLKINPILQGRNTSLDILFESSGYIAKASIQPFKTKH